MKAVILAGGMGTRIAEESHLRPKPMIEIGGRPILWHIMNIYTAHGVTDFVICLGYRGYMIKEYFANYVMHESDVTVDARTGEIIYHTNYAEPWRVTLVDTGLATMTGGRLKRVGRYLDPDESFCMTYGDGVADIDIGALIAFHARHGKLATVTAVAPPGRYGALLLQDDSGDPLQREAARRQRADQWRLLRAASRRARSHRGRRRRPGRPSRSRAWPVTASCVPTGTRGFWQPMDTMRDRTTLETLWSSGKAPWKMWKG